MFLTSLLSGLLVGIALFVAWFFVFGKKVPIEDRHLVTLYYVAPPYAIGGLIAGPCFVYGYSGNIKGLMIAGGVIIGLVILESVILGLYYTIIKNKNFIC